MGIGINTNFKVYAIDDFFIINIIYWAFDQNMPSLPIPEHYVERDFR